MATDTSGDQRIFRRPSDNSMLLDHLRRCAEDHGYPLFSPRNQRKNVVRLILDHENDVAHPLELLSILFADAGIVPPATSSPHPVLPRARYRCTSGGPSVRFARE